MEILVGETVVFTYVGDSERGGDVIFVYSNCDHVLIPDSTICENCGEKCGEGFPHNFENGVCTRCSAECGTESTPHKWNDETGKCSSCGVSCEHTFGENHSCSDCGLTKAAIVTIGEEETAYLTLEEAFDAIYDMSGATVKLIKDVTYEHYASFVATDVIFDFNGHSMDSDDYIALGFDGDSVITSSSGYGHINESGGSTSVYCKTLENISSPFIELTATECSFVNVSADEVMLTSNVENVTFADCSISSMTFQYTDTKITVDGGTTIFRNDASAEVSLSNITIPEDYMFLSNLGTNITDVIPEGEKDVLVPKVEILDGMFFILGDEAQDGWDGNAAIDVYKNDEYLCSMINDEHYEYVKTQTLEDYDKNAEYKLVWKEGNFDSEISFAIYVDKELVKCVSDAEPLEEGEVIATILAAEADEAVKINLGEKADEANVRYAEINGVVTEIEELDNAFSFEFTGESALVEVTEKNADGEVVKTQYFYVAENGTVTKLSMDSYMYAYDGTSIRTANPMGIRFKSHILTATKFEETEYIIDEYGFIIATETSLDGEELTFDFSKYVTGVAYNKESRVDVVFDNSNDSYHIFSGYLKNIPVTNYKTNLVCKTYTKLTVNGEQFVIYGEPIVGNVYDSASALLEDDTLDAEMRKKLTEIILNYENSIGVPGDELYP